MFVYGRTYINQLDPGSCNCRGPIRVNPSRCVGKESTQVIKGKQRAKAVRPRFLDDPVYRAEVLAAASAEAARETEYEGQGDALAVEGRWDR
jgi:hypothetical protein